MVCARIEVPLNWDDPAGDQITITLARIPATNPEARQGSLIVNPGGPGVSGIGYLQWMPMMASEAVQEVYDLVSFDPRGVGQSTPIDCLDDAGLDQYMAISFNDDEEGLAKAIENAKAFGKACSEQTGPLLEFVDTASAAHDMDAIRAVLGDNKLNYLGYSYGTFLGANYAEAFPELVGRMVLDGAIDPTRTARESEFDQMVAFDRSLTEFAAWCAKTRSCPAGTSQERILADTVNLLNATLDKPLPAGGGRQLTQSLAFQGILSPLYSERTWPELGQALAEAFQGDGTQLVLKADELYHRDSSTGRWEDNMAEAIVAINCADSPVNGDLKEMGQDAAALREAAPTLGQFAGYGAITCSNWPFPARIKPHAIKAAGAAPILVVGTTGDPATPYEEAVALADQLESGVLLTLEGEQHTAYGSSNQCITAAVDGLLISGTVPKSGLRC
jgi:pimeloyl-ACP methyl ester carboxylesterase